MIVGMQMVGRDEYFEVVDNSQQLDFEFQGKSFITKCGYRHSGKDFDVEATLFQNKIDKEDYYLKLNWFINNKIVDEQEMAFYSEKEIKNSQELQFVVLNILHNRNQQSDGDFYNN